MSRQAWSRVIQKSWHALSQLLWPPSPQAERQRQLCSLNEKLHQHQLRLVRQQRRLERLRDRLTELDRDVERLSSAIQTQVGQNATEQVLQDVNALECVRQTRLHTSRRLQRHEEAYQRRQLVFERLKKERTVIQSQPAPT